MGPGKYIEKMLQYLEFYWSHSLSQLRLWSWKLQYTDSEYIKKISIKHDMNKEERTKETELLREAKCRQAEDSNDNFIYVVRGPISKAELEVAGT